MWLHAGTTAEIGLAVEPAGRHGVLGQDRVAPAVVGRRHRHRLAVWIAAPASSKSRSSRRRTATGPSGRSRATVYPISPAPTSLVGGDPLGAVGQEEPVEQRGVVRVRHVGARVGADRRVRGLPHQLDRAVGAVLVPTAQRVMPGMNRSQSRMARHSRSRADGRARRMTTVNISHRRIAGPWSSGGAAAVARRRRSGGSRRGATR